MAKAMRSMLIFMLINSGFLPGFACISSAPRTQYAPQAQANYAPPALARAAESVPSDPVVSSHSEGGGLSPEVTLTEFSSNGYNSVGGGPVNEGTSLKCNLDGRPCCWANVGTPDDQLDWHVASGLPDRLHHPNVTIDGHYLLAYAVNAAPSDEAQLTSCAIACASSPIRVRVRHWQKTALLQVCLKESFPDSVNYTPLLNCQEFPPTPNGPQYTEVELPKNSLVDVVFVASDFVDQTGSSIAIIDDIEIIYEHDPRECPTEGRQTAERVATANENAAGSTASEGSSASSSGASRGEATLGSSANSAGVVGSSASRSSASSASSSSVSQSSSSSSSTFEGSENSITGSVNSQSSRAQGITTKKNEKIDPKSEKMTEFTGDTQEELAKTCKAVKCTFEDGNTCGYEDKQVQDSIRGLTTRFQVVKGQFMNRITGIKESPEGDYYAATFIYPNEKAGLSADVGYIDETRRIRFQYYESTHGVQLKGCCDSIDSCPFGSDKFVSVSDRMWKYGDFSCPRGTQKVIFFCENSRTNQGACALDDVQVLDSSHPVETARPLC